MLVLLSVLFIYLPPVQNYLVGQAVRYAGEATGMQINIRRIRLSFPLDISIQGVDVCQASQDTLLSLERCVVSVRPLSLRDKTWSVRSLSLEKARIRTGSLIRGMTLEGEAGELAVKADRILPADEQVWLNSLLLSNASFRLRIDSLSLEEDTVSVPLNWRLFLHKAALKNVDFHLEMPADSLRLDGRVTHAVVTDGEIDLARPAYSAARFSLLAERVNYDGDNRIPASGTDVSHIGLSHLMAVVDSVRYEGEEMQARIHTFSVRERSGLTVTSLTGLIRSDSLRLDIPELALCTPASAFRLSATVPWNVFADHPQDKLHALLTASIGKADLLMFAGDLPSGFRQAYPDRPVNITADLEGNLSRLHLQQLKAELPGAFTASLSGYINAVTDSLHRSAGFELEAQSGTLDFLATLLPEAQRDAFTFPPGMQLTGEAGLSDQGYSANLTLTEDKATVALNATFHPVTESYSATLKIDSLEPVHFMPKDSLFRLTGSIDAEGKGFDLFKTSTCSTIEGSITDIRYGGTSVSNITFDASLKEHSTHVRIKSDYPLARLDMSFDGTLTEEAVSGMLIADVDTIDLYGLHLMESPFSTSFQLFADGKSNLKETHQLDLSLGNWTIATGEQQFSPKLLVVKARTDTVSTRTTINAGDFMISLDGQVRPGRLLEQAAILSDSIHYQLATDSIVNMERLQPLLPDLSLKITAAKDNPVYNILRDYRIGFNSFFLDAATSPAQGVRLDTEIFAAYRDTFLIDTMRAAIRPDPQGLLYSASVIKNRYRQQTPFTVHLKGALKNAYADAELTYVNHRKETGMHLGIRAYKEKGSMLFRLFPEKPVIAFNAFALEPDNYVRYRSMRDIDANVRLEGINNASLWLHSVHNEGMPPEVHFEISQIDLGNVSKGFTGLPPMQGVFSADVQYVPFDTTFMVAADANIDNLFYQNGRVGEMMLNAVYLPLDNHEHQADAHLYRDRKEIVTGTALYHTDTDYLKGSLDITTLPLPMFTPFIPDGMATLNGALNGHVDVEGTTDTPVVNGYMQVDTGSVYVAGLTTRFRLDSKKIEMNDSRLNFDKYNIFATGKNPFIINGTIDFSNPSQTVADLRLNANNVQVLDARRSKESMVYGKLFVNLASTVKGRLDALTVRSDLQLLGGTDVTYVMGESSLTVQDRLEDLVTFTSFADTLIQTRRRRITTPAGGMDMMAMIHIDPVVQFRADITPDRASYVELEGGGDLSFQYTRQGDMILNGRYTLQGGNIKYALPIIPLKEFRIKPDSYVQWNGDPMNPALNLAATERVRASVTNPGGSAQPVNFDVGILLRDRLQDMSLQFTIDAPENITVRNELASAGEEERAKRAIAMIMTGMYLDGNNTGANNMNMGAALNSFLESEINNIAGNTLNTVDISVGVDTYDSDPLAGGGQRTDYSFSFAKRFYNDRIRVVIGGKVSSGNVQQHESFIDNFSFEYRLDQAGTRYVKLFHDRNYENLLENDIRETGVGILLRKKMLHLRELFNFQKKKPVPVPEEEAPDIQQKQDDTSAAR